MTSNYPNSLRSAPANTYRIAAFFDIDGTLLATPSLERRFFSALRKQRAIPTTNYFLWLAHSFRVAPRGMQTILHANKMYLRGIPAIYGALAPIRPNEPKPRALFDLVPSAPSIAPPEFPFLPTALNQAACHAAANHAVILLSGTLAPLAHQVAVALTIRLAARNLPAQVGVCATHLETISHRWTGRITGDPMFGPAKAQALRQIAAEQNLDLRRCYAYGDTLNDRWMLAAVGRPAAVNPTTELERVARLNDWPVLRWPSPAQAHQQQNEAADRPGASRHSVVSSATAPNPHPATETPA